VRRGEVGVRPLPAMSIPPSPCCAAVGCRLPACSPQPISRLLLLPLDCLIPQQQVRWLRAIDAPASRHLMLKGRVAEA